MILKHNTKIDLSEWHDEILELLNTEGLHWANREPLLSGAVNMSNIGFLFIRDKASNSYGDFTCTYMSEGEEHYFDNATDHEDITDEILAIIASPEDMLIRSKSQAKRRVLEELNR